MNVTPKAGPSLAGSQPNPHAAADSKARAIAILTGQVPQVNQNNISPEEKKAVEVQSDTSEATSTEAVEAIQESTPVKEEPKEENPLSQQYAILARKEKALRAKVQAQETALKAREEAIKAQEQAMKATEEEYRTKYISRDKLKEDPWSALTEEGLTYDQLTEKALNYQPMDPQVKRMIDRQQAQIEKLEAERQADKKAVEQNQSAAYQQAVKQIKSEAEALVKGDPEAFETIAATDSVSDVVELIEEVYKKDGVLLTVEEAAQEVEQYLLDEALKLARIKKIQAKLATPKQSTPKPTGTQPPQQQQTQMKTLTNSTTPSRQLTARQRAMAAFKGELK